MSDMQIHIINTVVPHYAALEPDKILPTRGIFTWTGTAPPSEQLPEARLWVRRTRNAYRRSVRNNNNRPKRIRGKLSKIRDNW